MSRTLTAAADTALSAEHVPLLCFIELQFASGTVRVCNAGYDFQWNGFTWLGAGNVASIQPIQEGAELQMYGVAMQLSGVNPALVSSALGEQYQGLPAKIWVAPLGGRALQFDGTTQYVSIPIGTPVLYDAGSFECWIQPITLPGTEGTIVADYNGAVGEGGGWLFELESDGSLNARGNGIWALGTAAGKVPVGQRTHVAFTVDSAGIAGIYVNGQLSISGANTFKFKLQNLFVGRASHASVLFANAIIDEARIYSRALSAAEVADHSRGYFADNTGLVGYWPFDDGQGTVATDESGNANHGTLVSGPTWVDSLTGRPRILTSPVGPFQFRMDTMAVEMGDTATITLTAESPMAAWDRPRMRRYTSEDQAQLYPADKFFEFVPAVQSLEILF